MNTLLLERENQVSFESLNDNDEALDKINESLLNSDSFDLRKYLQYENEVLRYKYNDFPFPRNKIEEYAYDLKNVQLTQSQRNEKTLKLMSWVYFTTQADAILNKLIFYKGCNDSDDAFSVFTETFLKCVKNYNPIQGEKKSLGNFENYFNSYFQKELFGFKRKSLPLTVKKPKKKNQKEKIKVESRDAFNNNDIDRAIYNDYEVKEMNKELREILNNLPDNAGEIISYKFCLNGYDSMKIEKSWSDCCEKFNLGQKKVRNIVEKGFETIRRKYPDFAMDYNYSPESYFEEYTSKDIANGRNED